MIDRILTPDGGSFDAVPGLLHLLQEEDAVTHLPDLSTEHITYWNYTPKDPNASN